jgi:hypothetical protein
MPAADAPLVQVTTDDKLVGWWKAFDFRAVGSSSVRKDSFVEVDNVCRCRRRTAGLKRCAAIASRIYEPRQRPKSTHVILGRATVNGARQPHECLNRSRDE